MIMSILSIAIAAALGALALAFLAIGAAGAWFLYVAARSIDAETKGNLNG